MQSLKRKNKVLETEVVKLLMELEKKVLTRSHMWKKEFKYDLCLDYARNIKTARESVIIALSINKEFVREKLYNYDIAKSAMNNCEFDLILMGSKEFNIISSDEWAEYCMLIDDINTMIGRLTNNLENKLSSSES